MDSQRYLRVEKGMKGREKHRINLANKQLAGKKLTPKESKKLTKFIAGVWDPIEQQRLAAVCA